GCIFFFQAEDGIRAFHVTGVQTCALPISMKTATHSFYLEAVQHAIERIVDGLDRAIPLESLARGACLSPFHFHRVFRGMTGETPLELARRLRLERAAWQLVQT